MATTSESVKSSASELPLLNKVNLTLGVLLYLSFYSFIRTEFSYFFLKKD